MTTPNYSYADILSRLLIQLGLGTDPVDSDDWPVYVTQEPDTPDNVITLFDTAGVLQGRRMVDGVMSERSGIQVRVRSSSHATGYSKIASIASSLDTNVHQNLVSIGAYNYIVHLFNRTSGPIPLGEEVGISKRRLFTLNGLVLIETL